MAEEGLAEARQRIIGEWLSFYGPVTQDFIQKKLGLRTDLLKFALKDLLDSHWIISGRLVTDSAKDEICDRENFEILLRLARKAAVPDFKPVEIVLLPVFLATVQGTTEPQGSIDSLYNCLEQMVCYPAPAELWESEIFPARMDPYDTSWMDSALQESHLLLVGTPNR